jgi:signal transduction histidine kinase/DNA-binding response OmpR family regulator
MCAPDPFQPAAAIDNETLLEGDEVVLTVDDFAQIAHILQTYLQHRNLKTLTAASAEEFRRVLTQAPVALVLLDINLPDANGVKLIPEIKAANPDTAIIMISGVTDLQTALECIRHGADDYLTKPIQFEPFWETVRKVLEKRRLKICNRRYQKQIEQANFRLQLLHELAMKMNTAYLSMTALDEILRAVLVGITAEEGLRFNRAFLALFDASGQVLEGRMAIGPGCREDAGRIWQEISQRDLRFHNLIDSIREHDFQEDDKVNQVVRSLRIPADCKEHLLIQAAAMRKTVNVRNGQCDCGGTAPLELMGLLEEDSFVVVPLFSQSRSLGVIIADHFVTGKQIDDELAHALESFASQASLAIEHCGLYMGMERKIKELESLTQELEKNKDLLVEAERYAAVGQVAAQLAHNIRNPVTAIGGTARLLSRKISDPQQLNFLGMMTREVGRIEQALEDLLNFVDKVPPVKERVLLYPLIIKSLMLFYGAMQKQGIEYEVVMQDRQLLCGVDPKQIRRVFVHLIRNAVEAMERGGRLVIDVEVEAEELRVAVLDSGIGIAETDIRRATDPFYTTKTAGTGVGLALVDRIIKDHDGTLAIRRRESGGTEVIITLPF